MAAFLLVLLALLAVATEWLCGRLLPADAFDAPPLKRYIRLREIPPGSKLSLTPDDAMLKASDSLVKKPYRLAVDADGFVEPSIIHEKADLTIAFLGGSTTESTYVDETRRYPYLAGRRVERALGLKVNALNGGASGNHTMHANLILVSKVLPMRPDVVVMMEAMNDLGTMLLEGRYWNTNPSRSIIEAPAEALLKGSVSDGAKLMLRNMFPNTFTAFRRARAGLARINPDALPGIAADDEFGAKRGEKLRVDESAIRADFRSSLVQFVQTTRAWGAKPVLMTQASRITEKPDAIVLNAFHALERQNGVSYATYKRLYDSLNATTREVAATLDVPLVDLAAGVEPSRKYIYDSVHLNEAGSDLVANLVAERLTALLRRP